MIEEINKMKKLKHQIHNNKYILDNGEVTLLTIEIDEELNQVVITTNKEVFAGPVEYLKLTEEIN